jgi:hypothetical protein
MLGLLARAGGPVLVREKPAGFVGDRHPRFALRMRAEAQGWPEEAARVQ